MVKNVSISADKVALELAVVDDELIELIIELKSVIFFLP
jgi:hypothetical protein